MSLASSLHWGISTLGCPELNLAQAETLADRYNVKFLEIRTLENSNDAFETLYTAHNLPVMRRLAAAGRCRILDSSFRLTVNGEKDRELLLKYARTADDFHIPYIRIFGGGKAGDELTGEMISHALDTLAWFETQNFQVRLALETHDVCGKPENCRRIAALWQGELPIIWDVHHTWQIAGEDLETTLHGFAGQLAGVHFKDSRFLPDGTVEFTIPGQGTLPLKEFFTLLIKNDFDGPVTLEHEKFWRKNLPELPVALDAWKSLIGS